MAAPRGLKILIALIMIIGALWSAGHRDPWDPDETRYLQITREMLETGDLLLLHLNGEPYSDKPPLFFWILAPFVAVLGPDSAIAGMMPSLLAFLGLMIAASRLGRAAGLEPRAVEWGIVMLEGCLLPAVLLGGCRMDLLFALWCTLALEQLIACGHHDRSRGNHLLAWLWIGLGILTKGPLALALPLLAALALATEQRRALVNLLRGPGPLLAGAMVALWLVPASLQAGWVWLETIAFHQTAGRLSDSFAHSEPWWYHIATVPLTLLPWSMLVLPASLAALSRRQALPAPGRLIAIYPLTSLVFLTLLSGKTFLYPLPLFAPACLVAAWWLVRDPLRWSRRLALAVAGTVMAVLGAAMWLALAPHPDMQLDHVTAAVLSISVGGPGLVAALASARRATREAAMALALCTPLLVGIGLQPVIQRFNGLLSLRPFGQALATARAEATGSTAVYSKLQPGFLLFSTDRLTVLEDQSQLQEALDAGTLVAINAKDAARLEGELEPSWRVLGKVPYRHTSVLLITGAHVSQPSVAPSEADQEPVPER